MSSRKALVIGLDGVPQTLISEYISMGVLPNVKSILSDGKSLVQMDASVPDVSSTSWTSFMTGANPGEHGIFGFMELRQGTYKLSFPNYNDVKAPSIWEMLDGKLNGRRSALSDSFKDRLKGGLRSVVLNMPQTFPATAMNGVLTAGFVCPDLKKGTYPDAAYDYLRSSGYMQDVDAAKAAEKPDEFFNDVFRALDRRAEAYEHFYKTEKWDLFIGVITETDRVHHFFFDAARDKTHKFHERFVEVYRKMDAIIGSLYSRFMEETGGKGLFMTMSDHGFTVIRKELYMNTWLKDNGYLKINPAREYFEQIDFGTKAFALDPARIYVNAEGRYPGASVSANDRKAVRDELKERLQSIVFEGSPVIKHVFTNEELYSGACSEAGPDLVCIANDGFDLKGNLKRPEAFGTSHFRGMHTRHDAHCILPSGEVPPGRLEIEGLAAVILKRFAD